MPKKGVKKMFVIDKKTKQINLTRGNIASIDVDATIEGEEYTFKPGDIVRFKVFKARKCDDIELQKDVTVAEETKIVNISLTGSETKIGELINRPTEFWYEIELNPDTAPQTLVGYDLEGKKVFMLYPEGEDK